MAALVRIVYAVHLPALAIPLAIGVANSQVPGPSPSPQTVRIFISDDVLQGPLGGVGSGRSAATMLGSLTAFVDNVLCVTVSLTDGSNRGTRPANVIEHPIAPSAGVVSTGSGGVLFEVGLPAQPDACRASGGLLTFVDGRGQVLAQSFVFRPSSAYEITSAESVPSTGGPADVVPAQTGSGGLAER